MEPYDKNFESIEACLTQEYNKAEKEPKLLFKYMSIDTTEKLCRFIKVFQDNRIYFPSVQELNDSFEGTGTQLFYFDKELYDSETRKKYRVLSLSSNCFSPAMWAHYGGNRLGVCIGFYKGNHLEVNNKSHFKHAEEVKYVKSRNEFSCDEEAAIKRDLFRKHEDWIYEKEWRIIDAAKDPTLNSGQADKIDYYFEFDADDIACIIWGEKTEDAIKQLIKSVSHRIPTYTIFCDFEKYAYCIKNERTGTIIFDRNTLFEDIEASKLTLGRNLETDGLY